MINKARNNTYWDSLISGASECAFDRGANLYIGGTMRESYVEELCALVREVRNRKADAVIISPQNSSQMTAELNELKRTGCSVIFVDSFLNSTSFDACFMTDNVRAGHLAAEHVLKRLRAKGVSEEEDLFAGIEVGSAQSQTIMERLAGFNGYWNRNAPDRWKVVDEIISNPRKFTKSHEVVAR